VEALAQALADCPSLLVLQQRMRGIGQVAVTSALVLARNLYQARRWVEARCVGLLALLSGRKPQLKRLNELRLGEIVPTDFVAGLGVAFEPALDLTLL
jgi:hypothetical protein